MPASRCLAGWPLAPTIANSWFQPLRDDRREPAGDGAVGEPKRGLAETSGVDALEERLRLLPVESGHGAVQDVRDHRLEP